jgi:hypothetical protein
MQKYGLAPAAGIRERFNRERERVEVLHMASQILRMADIAQIVRDACAQRYLLSGDSSG